MDRFKAQSCLSDLICTQPSQFNVFEVNIKKLTMQHFQHHFIFLCRERTLLYTVYCIRGVCVCLLSKSFFYRNTCHSVIWIKLYLRGSWRCARGPMVWARSVLLRWDRWRRCRWVAGQLQGRSRCSAGSPCYRGLNGSTHKHTHTNTGVTHKPLKSWRSNLSEPEPSRPLVLFFFKLSCVFAWCFKAD